MSQMQTEATPAQQQPAQGQPQGVPAPPQQPASAGQSQGAPAAPQQVVKPEGISDEEWSALGDPGKAAIVRERTRAQEAERALAASRARPGPPRPQQGQPGQQPQQGTPAGQPQGGGQQGPPQQTDPADFASVIQQAVTAAVRPLYEANAQRDADAAAQVVMQAVTDAAGTRLHDPSDALYGIDLQAVVDGTGRPDPVKITAQIDSLLQRKPHLGKPAPSGLPVATPGGPQGATQAPQQSIEEATKASLARMQAAHGIRPAASTP